MSAAVVMPGAAVVASPSSAVLDLDRVNALDLDAFVAVLGGAFEHAAWVAEAAWEQRPFDSVDALHAAMMAAVWAMGNSVPAGIGIVRSSGSV